MTVQLLVVGQLGVHLFPVPVAAAIPAETDRVQPPDPLAVQVAPLLRSPHPLDPLGQRWILRPAARHVAIAMAPAVLGQRREHVLPPRLLELPNDAQGVQLPHAIGVQPARALVAADPVQPRGQLAMRGPCVRDVAVPVLTVERFQLGHHGIPVPSDKPARPHGPGETDRVQPLDPVLGEPSLLPLTAAVEDPDRQRRIFLVARRHVAMAVCRLEGQEVRQPLIPTVGCLLRIEIPRR